MTRGEARFSHVATVLVAGTGLVYGWMRYFAEPTDPYAVVNHPLQPDLQHLHLLFAPLVVFAAGLIWRVHVWRRVRSGFPLRRRSGLVLFATLLPMIASGYLLQVAESELWTDAWIVAHVATSCLWIAVYLGHQLAPRRAAEADEPAA